MRKYIDIGANMLDDMYSGMYNGKTYHAADPDAVLQRAAARGVERLIVTAGSVQETADALSFCTSRSGRTDIPELYSSAGVHPTRCTGLSSADVSVLAGHVAKSGRHVGGPIAAVGELGIDHDRLHFCAADAQAAGFEAQLRGIAAEAGGECGGCIPLPLFLHLRGDEAASTTFFDILQRTRGLWSARGGVVHSFTGTADDVKRILEFGLSISVNGVSFRTAENIEVSTLIPEDRFMVETDAPWCDIRPTHPSYALLTAARDRLKKEANGVEPADLATPQTCRKDKFKEGFAVKGRNEPGTIADVLLVAAEARHADPTVLAEFAYQNTMKMFFP